MEKSLKEKQALRKEMKRLFLGWEPIDILDAIMDVFHSSGKSITVEWGIKIRKLIEEWAKEKGGR